MDPIEASSKKKSEKRRKKVVNPRRCHRYWYRFICASLTYIFASSRAAILRILFCISLFLLFHTHQLMFFHQSQHDVSSMPLHLCLRNSSLCSFDDELKQVFFLFSSFCAVVLSNTAGSQLEFPFCGFRVLFHYSGSPHFAKLAIFKSAFVHSFMAKNKTFGMTSAFPDARSRLCPEVTGTIK